MLQFQKAVPKIFFTRVLLSCVAFKLLVFHTFKNLILNLINLHWLHILAVSKVLIPQLFWFKFYKSTFNNEMMFKSSVVKRVFWLFFDGNTFTKDNVSINIKLWQFCTIQSKVFLTQKQVCLAKKLFTSYSRPYSTIDTRLKPEIQYLSNCCRDLMFSWCWWKFRPIIEPGKVAFSWYTVRILYHNLTRSVQPRSEIWIEFTEDELQFFVIFSIAILPLLVWINFHVIINSFFNPVKNLSINSSQTSFWKGRTSRSRNLRS